MALRCRGSCSLFSPIAQKMRDNSGTSTSDWFLQLKSEWQQWPETPALISRIRTSSSHHTPHRYSDSVEGKGQGRAKSLKRFTPLTPLGSPKCDIAEQHHPIRDRYRCDDNSPGSETGKTNIDCYSKSKSATSALSPGPKASARQGPEHSRRLNRSSMNRIVADDMLP